MGEFRDKYKNSTNISDILVFVYVKNSPIILGNVGDSWKKNGRKSKSPALDQTLIIYVEQAIGRTSSGKNGRKRQSPALDQTLIIYEEQAIGRTSSGKN